MEMVSQNLWMWIGDWTDHEYIFSGMKSRSSQVFECGVRQQNVEALSAVDSTYAEAISESVYTLWLKLDGTKMFQGSRDRPGE
jgi:hypothetical protein